ncbi:hypothetical protein BH09BAC5_BH09BAC5_19860 [soil metagenome]
MCGNHKLLKVKEISFTNSKYLQKKLRKLNIGFWCKYAESLPDPGNLLDEIKRIQKVLGSIISSAKERL